MDISPELIAAPRTTRYRIREHIGSGRSGLVYRAIDRARNLAVALKSLRFLTPEEIYYLKNEFRTLQDIYHPNLVQLYDLFVQPDKHCFYTMEFVDGLPFTKFARGRSSSVDYDLLRIALGQAAEGIETLHHAGIAHRDIKPSNVLVEPDGRAVLLDFGLILRLKPREAELSSTRAVAGTPDYMAPELAVGGMPTPESDWYSFGVMLYESLATKKPVRGGDLSPRTIVPNVPVDLDRLVLRLLDTDPRRRAGAKQCMACARDVVASDKVLPLSVELHGSGEIFVGREREIGTLQDAYNESNSGSRVVVRLQGEPGIGKTALVERFIDTVDDAAGDVAQSPIILRSRCHEQEAIQFKALDGLVDNLSHVLAARPGILQGLKTRDLPALKKVFPVLTRSNIESGYPQNKLSEDPHVNLQRAFSALQQIVEILADRYPVIVWIDDFQWSDRDSIPFLHDWMFGQERGNLAAGDADDRPLPLVIISHRSTEGQAVVDQLFPVETTTTHCKEIELSTLGIDESRKLFDTYVGRSQAEKDGIFAKLADDAEGVPLFLMELAHYCRKFSPEKLELLSLPRNLDEVLGRRLVALPDAHRRILELVAVARRPLPEDLLQDFPGADPNTTTAIYTLCRENLLRRSTNRGRPMIETYHESIRQALLPKARSPARVRMHLEVAKALEKHNRKNNEPGLADGDFIADDYELLVEHYQGAEEFDKVAEYALLAGRAADDRLSFNRAANYLSMALKLRGRGFRDWELRQEFAGALGNAGRAKDSGRQYLKVGRELELAESDTPGVPDRILHATMQKVRAAEQFLYGGMLSEGLRHLRDVFDDLHLRFPASARDAQRISLRNRLRLLPTILGLRRFRVREEWDSLAQAKKLRLETLWIAAKGTVMLDYSVGDVMISRYMREAIQVGESFFAVRAIGLEASVYANKGGDFLMRRSRSLMQEAKHIRESAIRAIREKSSERSHDPALIAEMAYAKAMLNICDTAIQWCSGNWRGCAQPAKEAMAALQNCHGTNFDIAIVQGFALSARMFLGDIKGIRRDLAGMLLDAQRRGDQYFLNVFQSGYLVFLHLAEDTPERELDNRKSMLEGVPAERFTSLHFHRFNARTNALLYTGNAWKAWFYVVKNWGLIQEAGFHELACIGAHMREIRARCAIAAATAEQPAAETLHSRQLDQLVEYSPDRLLRLAESEAKEIEKRALPHTPALAAVIRAGIASQLGDRSATQRQLQKAAAGFARDDVSMELHREATEYQLTKLTGEQTAFESVRKSMIKRGIHRPETMAETLLPGQTG